MVMKKKVMAVVQVEPSDAMKLLLDEVDQLRQANTMQSKRIDWTVADNVSKALEIDHLNKARLKEATDGEDAMRVMIKILSARADIIEHLTGRVQVWMETAFKLNRKNNTLESCVRADRRANSVFRLGLNRES